jgi:ribosome recycling factor
MSEKPKLCKEAQDDLEQSIEQIANYLEEAMSLLKKGKEECLAEDWDLVPPDEIENIIDKLSQMVLELRLKI